MAPDTRSHERLNDMEQQLQLHTASIDSVNSRLDLQGQAINELKISTAKIEDCLKDISAQLSSLTSNNGKKPVAEGGSSYSSPRVPPFGSFHEIHSPQQPYTIPTKQSRIEDLGLAIRLRMGNGNSNVLSPELVTSLKQVNERVVQISLTNSIYWNAHTFALTESGKLYAFGAGDRGQLGIELAANQTDRGRPERVGVDLS